MNLIGRQRAMEEKSLNLAVFAYNFPHKKTQDFLLRLILNGIKPDIVLAADPIKLSIPKPTVRVKPRHIDLTHPKDICAQFGIPYFIVDHNSSECCEILKAQKIKIGLISGARILELPTIKSVEKGIVNLHPGLLPEVRGLDALQWALYEELPLGVTAHVINTYVDAGYILKKARVQEYPDDTLIDLSLRLEQAQTNIITDSIHILSEAQLDNLEKIDHKTYKLHRKMPSHLERELPFKLQVRLAKLKG